MGGSQPRQAKHFRLASQYRRSAVYVLLGAILAGCLAFAVDPIVQQQRGPNAPRGGPYVISAVFVTLALGLCLGAFRWRLRVDHRGVARRRLRRWDLWPWDAFRDGRVRKGASLYCFKWPERRWWERTLSFELLEDADRDELRKLCSSLWVAPAEPEVPDQITLRYDLRKWARLTPEGIFIDKLGFQPDYRWSDVSELRIVRVEHDRHDFQLVEIELPDRTIKLRVHKGSPNWRGADAESIAALLRHHVPPERTLIAASNGRPKSLKEADYRLAEIKQRRRQLQLGKKMILGFIVAFCVSAIVVAMGLLLRRPMAIILGGYAAMFFPCWWMFHDLDKAAAKGQADLETWRSEIIVPAAKMAPDAGQKPDPTLIRASLQQTAESDTT